MALSVARPRHRSLTNPFLIHLFSTSSSSSSSSSTPPTDQFTDQDATDSHSLHSQPPPQQQQQQPSFSSYFTDVKASLKQQQQNPQSQHQLNRPNLPPLRGHSNVNPSFSRPEGKIVSLEEIRKNLAEFRRRSSAPPPTESKTSGPEQQQPQQLLSFQELYKRNMMRKSEDAHGSTEFSPINNQNPVSGDLSFEVIRESLRLMKSKAPTNTGKRSEDAMSFSALKDRLKLNPMDKNESTNSTVIGGIQGLPLRAFEKEDASVKEGMSTEFVKMYSYGELGQKLRILRPEVKEGEKGWFSLEELNERLRKLREMEEKEAESRIGGKIMKDVKQSLVRLKQLDEEKTRKISIQRLNLLGQWGTTPKYMLHPPKEDLVEKYFHPDNMSSAEKLKIELAKVREEFKMSESDCGSSRVQVALLTTKIKHLSSVLHKKDKHSRKGLLAMVQRRKKLLKYLRRTDWDSYCLVLSKLGLRDNPDFKN